MKKTRAHAKHELGNFTNIFKALSDPVRLQLLLLMRDSPKREINACLPLPKLKLSQPTLSYHFKVLYQSGLVTKEKRSQWVYFGLKEKMLDKIIGFVRKLDAE